LWPSPRASARQHPLGGEDERFVTLHPNAILMPTGGAVTGPSPSCPAPRHNAQATPFMPRLTFAQAALAAAFLSPVSASAGTTTQNATFLVVHGIPGRDVAETADPLLPVDVLVAGKYCLLSGLTYGSISGTFICWA